MNIAYLLIGGNLGDRAALLDQAISRIASRCGKINKTSSVYESDAWGSRRQPHYLNQALALSTSFDAAELLTITKLIEIELGRVRSEQYAARTMDIDILYFNDVIINTDSLTIPHPRISERKFVLVPMNEIAEMHFDPVLKKTVKEMLDVCSDNLKVHIVL
jgi:2-amino-4-hydroxy-6-hydroxymethyldihydropteridine diphosphokinase